MSRDKRYQELTKLKAYTDDIEKEVTLLLQSLQWDSKLTTEKHPMVTCQRNSNHRIPLNERDTHEKQCYLTELGYGKEETFLPEPVDPHANTLVKFSKLEIADIIRNAAIDNPLFKRGVGCQGAEPLTVERLQRAYTADERRAIHDAVVNAAPFCHDLTDLDLLSSSTDAKESQKKSRLEILAELRNMKRRRTKYRVAPKTRNYSDVLRDVIKTQMDSYGEATSTIIKTEYGQNVYVSQKVSNISSENVSPHGAVIKLERESPESHHYSRHQRDEPRERYRARSTDKSHNDDRRAFRKDNISSKERDRSYNESQQIEISRDTEENRERKYGDNGRRHHKDKYSSKEWSRNYDEHPKKDTRDRSREKRYDDDHRSRYPDYSSRDRRKDYESSKRDLKYQHDIKKERASQESESCSDYIRDSNRDRSRSKEIRHCKQEKVDKHKRRGPDNKLERESLQNQSYTNGETSRKRHRSRSKDRRHNDKMKRRDEGKHSYKRDKEHDSRKSKQDYSSGRFIKQERESP